MTTASKACFSTYQRGGLDIAIDGRGEGSYEVENSKDWKDRRQLNGKVLT